MKPEERDDLKEWIISNVPEARKKPSEDSCGIGFYNPVGIVVNDQSLIRGVNPRRGTSGKMGRGR